MAQRRLREIADTLVLKSIPQVGHVAGTGTGTTSGQWRKDDGLRASPRCWAHPRRRQRGCPWATKVCSSSPGPQPKCSSSKGSSPDMCFSGAAIFWLTSWSRVPSH